MAAASIDTSSTEPSGFEAIRREVTDAGGVKCFQMQRLREASLYKKLGPGVNEEISKSLRQKGLGHSQMGLYQHETVYVFEEGSDAARLINAVLSGASDDGAQEILKAVAPAAQSSTNQKLAEVKALLVQMQDVFSDDHEQPLAA
jgi:hypothetical protein